MHKNHALKSYHKRKDDPKIKAARRARRKKEYQQYKIQKSMIDKAPDRGQTETRAGAGR